METINCPFNTVKIYMATINESEVNVTADKAEYVKTVFEPCQQEKCAIFSKYYQRCGFKL